MSEEEAMIEALEVTSEGHHDDSNMRSQEHDDAQGALRVQGNMYAALEEDTSTASSSGFRGR